MKKDNYILLGLAALAALAIRRRTQSVGYVKYTFKKMRDIYAEMEYLQKAGIYLGNSYAELSDKDRAKVADARVRFGFNISRKAYTAGKNPDEAFYKKLHLEYKRLTKGVGDLPFKESTVRNANGDVVVIHRQYDQAADLGNAFSWYEDWAEALPGGYEKGYHNTLLYIGRGGKFRWSDKKSSAGTRLGGGIRSELFGEKAEGERRRYMAIISDKEGMTIDQMAESIDLTESSTRDGVIEAIRQFPNPNDARGYVLATYYGALEQAQEQERAQAYDPNYDVPF